MLFKRTAARQAVVRFYLLLQSIQVLEFGTSEDDSARPASSQPCSATINDLRRTLRQWWLTSNIPHAVSQVLMNSTLPIPLRLIAIELHLIDYVDGVGYVDFVEVAATSLANQMSVICWSADRYG